MRIVTGRSGRRSGFIGVSVLALVLWGGPASAYVITSTALGTTEGWDGPGQGSATIDWYLGWSSETNNGLPFGVALADVEAAVMAAMATWSAVADITWNYLGNAIANPTPDPFGVESAPQVNIYWDADDHGDGAPFDGQWNPSANTGNVLAHAFPPPDVQPAGIGQIFAGNVHMDRDEIWTTSGAPSIPFPTPMTSAAMEVMGLSVVTTTSPSSATSL